MLLREAFPVMFEGQGAGIRAIPAVSVLSGNKVTARCGDGNSVRRPVVLDLGDGHSIEEHFCDRHVLVLDFRLRRERTWRDC